MIGKVFVVGSYNQDLIFRVAALPAPGQTVLGDGMVGHGGKGMNQAVAAARMGSAAIFIGAIGDDVAGASGQQLARNEGVEARWEVMSDHPTGMASVVVDRQGENQIVLAAGANARLSAEFVTDHLDAGDADVVLLQLETSVAAAHASIAQPGITILNPAPSENLPDNWTLATIVTPNEHEFADLMGRPWEEDPAAMHEICRRSGVETMIVTLGASGCFVSHRQDSRWRRDADYRLIPVPAPPVKAVDTTGAGDCFNGVLAARLAASPTNLECAIATAQKAASLAVTRPGAADSMPKLAEM